MIASIYFHFTFSRFLAEEASLHKLSNMYLFQFTCFLNVGSYTNLEMGCLMILKHIILSWTSFYLSKIIDAIVLDIMRVEIPWALLIL